MAKAKLGGPEACKMGAVIIGKGFWSILHCTITMIKNPV